MYVVRLPKDDGEFEARHILYKKEHMKAFLGLLSCHNSEKLFNESVRQYNKLKKGKKDVLLKQNQIEYVYEELVIGYFAHNT